MRFTLESDEGLPIRGDLEVPAGARALVLLVHGFKGFKDWGFFPWLAETLCRHGFAVCRFNMSRSGIGENPDTFDRLDLFADDTFSGQIADLRTVAAYARAQADLPLFLLGHSRGGGVALLAARHLVEPRASARRTAGLRGVITWSAIARANNWTAAVVRQWRRDGHYDIENARTKQIMRMSTRILDDYEAHREELDILAAASRLEVPLLLVHGGRDETVPLSQSAEIAAAAPEASRLVIASATHTYNAIHPLVDVPSQLQIAALVSARFAASYV